MKSPLPYLGGKSRMVEKILPLLPGPDRHLTYVEPFCGGASMLFARRPVGIEVINDRNGDVIHFFRILRDQGDALRRYLQNTPYARAIYQEWSDPHYACVDELERAARTFFLARASFMAMAQREEDRAPVGFAVAKYLDNRARAMMNKVDDDLCSIRDRLRHVVMENEDVLEIIDRYDSENAVLYCDPPYVEETRKGGGYAFEYSDEDHGRLLERLKQSPGYVAISGYTHPIYAKALESQGWERHDFPWFCNSVRNVGPGKKEDRDLDARRMESLWLNPRLREYHHSRSTRQSVLDLECAALG